MNPAATFKSFAIGLCRLKHLLLITCLLGLASCSREDSQPTRATDAKSGVMHKYYPVFAVVKIPDAFIRQQGVSYTETNGWNFGSTENRGKVAAYVLAHPGEFSFTKPTGNFVPVVWSHKQTHIELLLDSQQEERDLNTYGMKTTGFEASVDVGDEDNQGNVQCSWWYGYGVHTKEPMGNSTDHGGADVLGGGIYPVGKPDMRALFQCKNTTLWVVVCLNRK